MRSRKKKFEPQTIGDMAARVAALENKYVVVIDNTAYHSMTADEKTAMYNYYKSVDSNGDPGEIKNADKPQIKALFSDGNISDLQVSFLSPEERQLFKAVVMYRQEVPNRFAETKTITVQLNRETPYGSVLPVERFDLSGFCTSRDHARRFARYAIKTRQLVDHGLTFKTSPQNCVGLIPGDYFRLVSEGMYC